MILCISVVSVVISPFSFLILLIFKLWFCLLRWMLLTSYMDSDLDKQNGEETYEKQ